MALITITGTFKDPNNVIATGGQIRFMLNNYMINTNSQMIMAGTEFTADINFSSGAFSASLESTADCTPATRFYKVRFVGEINGRPVIQEMGTITVPASPSSQQLYTLLSPPA